jgi:Tfp pilus assembly protein PilF
MVLNLQDRNEDLLKITGDSIKSGESSNYLFYFNGIGYYKNKMYNEASESFKKGLNFLEEDRTYEEQLLTLLAESYYKLKRTDEAFEYFEKVLEINPYNLYVLNNYSYYLTILNTSLDKAEEMSKKCILMDKHNFNYLDTYGWVLVKKGKYLEAYEILKKALDLGGRSDQNVVNHFNELIKIMNIKQ